MKLEELTAKAEKICAIIKNDQILGTYFTHDNPLSAKPWREFNYWNGQYALAKLMQPENILEVGTGFGQSTIALARGAGKALRNLVCLDLGIYGRINSDDKRRIRRWNPDWEDNLPYVYQGINEFKAENDLDFTYMQFIVNTQEYHAHPKRSFLYCHLTDYLKTIKFNMVLIDGEHEGRACYNDLKSFFRFAASGCLIECDDCQAPDVASSFEDFVSERGQVRESLIWKFLTSNTRYPQGGSFQRDQGLIIKK